MLLFADDLKLFHTIMTPNDAGLLQDDIIVLYDWGSFLLNISKCKVLTFLRKRTQFHYINYYLHDLDFRT